MPVYIRLIPHIAMIKELLNSVADALDDAIVLDIYRGDACVGVWTKRRKLAMSQQATLRKVAEKYGCDEVRVKMGNTEIEIMERHPLFRTQQDVIDFLRSKDNVQFNLITHGKSFPATDSLFVKVETIWLKFRADFSMVQQPPATIDGTLTISPSQNNTVLVEWEDQFKMFPRYSYNLKLSDIEVLQQSDVVAELL